MTIRAGHTGTPVKETEEIRRPQRTQPFVPMPPMTHPVTTPEEVPATPVEVPVTAPQRAS